MRIGIALIAALTASSCGGESPEPTYSVLPVELDLAPMRYNDDVVSAGFVSLLNESYFPLLVDQFAIEGEGAPFLRFGEGLEREFTLDIRERVVVPIEVRRPNSEERVLWSSGARQATLAVRVRGSGVYDRETNLPDLAFVETVFERIPITFELICDFDGDGVDSRECSGGRDCDDTNAAISPNAVERCDGFDNDCDGVKDDDCVDEDG